MTEDKKPSGPDLSRGVTLAAFKDGKLARPCRRAKRSCWCGRRRDLRDRAPMQPLSRAARRRTGGRRHRALPLASRLFRSLRTGEATRAPALNALAMLGGRAATATRSSSAKARACRSRAASRRRTAPRRQNRHRRRRRGGLRGGRDAAARGLRRRHHHAQQRRAPPVDRPNLSKDYLAGSAPEDWLPLRPDDFYRRQPASICGSGTSVAAIDAKARSVTLGNGDSCPSTGCCWRPAPSRCGCRFRAPTSRMSTPCARVADCRAIIEAAERRASARW